jgi:hypothetical protein
VDLFLAYYHSGNIRVDVLAGRNFQREPNNHLAATGTFSVRVIAMRRFFIIADVAHLRGADRDTHLRNLMCALARAWAAYHQADITFGYRLYDSTSNDYLLSSHLQRVAAELGEPKLLLCFKFLLSLYGLNT